MLTTSSKPVLLLPDQALDREGARLPALCILVPDESQNRYIARRTR